MINYDVRFRRFLAMNFKRVYKDFLAGIYNDINMVNSMFAIEGMEAEFDKIVASVLMGGKADFATYEKLTGDKYLFAYLKIMTYYIKSTYYSEMTDAGKYHPGKVLLDEKGEKFYCTEDVYLKRLCHVCNVNFNVMYNDVRHGNYWWEYDSATTLRKTIMASTLVIPVYKLQFLADKFLNRQIDIQRELVQDGGLSAKLIAELDAALLKMNQPIVYAWFEMHNGRAELIKSKVKPTNGQYYFIMYEHDIDFMRGTNRNQQPQQEMLK